MNNIKVSVQTRTDACCNVLIKWKEGNNVSIGKVSADHRRGDRERTL